MKTIKWAVVGTGYIANQFAEGMRLVENSTIKAVVSRKQESGNRYAEKYGCERVYTDLQKMLDAEEIDIVYLAVPNVFHYSYIKKVLEAGVSVLSEKPITDNMGQLNDILKTAKEKKLFVMEGMWTRCFPVIKQSKKWIQEGRIGRPLTLKAGFDIKTDKNDWQLWKAGIKYSAGSLRDVGIYTLAMAYLVFPEDPEHTFTNMKSNGEVDESFQMLLAYSEGRSALLSGAFNQAGIQKAEIIGENGRIVVGPEFWHPSEAELILNDGTKEYVSDKYKATGFQYEITDVVECLRRNMTECPCFTWKESLQIGRIIEETRKKWGIFYESDDTVPGK